MTRTDAQAADGEHGDRELDAFLADGDAALLEFVRSKTDSDQTLTTLMEPSEAAEPRPLQSVPRVVRRTSPRSSPPAPGPTGASPGPSPADLVAGSGQMVVMVRYETDEMILSDDELQLLAEIATGATADVAARHLELSARVLRRRLRAICDRLEVNTPIEAVVWAARRQLI